MDHTLLESFYEAMHAADGLSKIRAKSWTRFCEGGLPDRKRATFRYLPLQSLYTQQTTLPDGDTEVAKEGVLSTSHLALVNGTFVPTLSNVEGLTALPLSDAQTLYSTFLSNRTQRLLKVETDPFSLLNGALHSDGVFLYIPPGTEVKAPIQLLHIINGKGLHITPRIHIHVGAGSRLELIATLRSSDTFFMNSLLDIDVQASADVTLTTLNEAPHSTSFDALRVTLKRDSRFKATTADCGGRSHRHDMRVSLLEENAEALLYGAFCLSENRQAHAHLLVEHLAPHCRSSQLFKPCLTDVARSSFVGKIWVDQEAQKTDAFQLNNNLLLSEGSIAYSEPNLEIFADDVKASHGSTTGQLTDEELFYLTSRGVATKVAKELLVKGFIGEVAREMNPSCRDRVDEWARKLV